MLLSLRRSGAYALLVTVFWCLAATVQGISWFTFSAVNPDIVIDQVPHLSAYQLRLLLAWGAAPAMVCAIPATFVVERYGYAFAYYTTAVLMLPMGIVCFSISMFEGARQSIVTTLFLHFAALCNGCGVSFILGACAAFAVAWYPSSKRSIIISAVVTSNNAASLILYSGALLFVREKEPETFLRLVTFAWVMVAVVVVGALFIPPERNPRLLSNYSSLSSHSGGGSGGDRGSGSGGDRGRRDGGGALHHSMGGGSIGGGGGGGGGGSMGGAMMIGVSPGALQRDREREREDGTVVHGSLGSVGGGGGSGRLAGGGGGGSGGRRDGSDASSSWRTEEADRPLLRRNSPRTQPLDMTVGSGGGSGHGGPYGGLSGGYGGGGDGMGGGMGGMGGGPHVSDASLYNAAVEVLTMLIHAATKLPVLMVVLSGCACGACLGIWSSSTTNIFSQGAGYDNCHFGNDDNVMIGLVGYFASVSSGFATGALMLYFRNSYKMMFVSIMTIGMASTFVLTLVVDRPSCPGFLSPFCFEPPECARWIILICAFLVGSVSGASGPLCCEMAVELVYPECENVGSEVYTWVYNCFGFAFLFIPSGDGLASLNLRALLGVSFGLILAIPLPMVYQRRLAMSRPRDEWSEGSSLA